MNRFLFFILLFFTSHLVAQSTCEIKNHAFKSDEVCTYKIYYNWGALWLSAGEASFSATLAQVGTRTVYHFLGLGVTYPKYDLFYRVRDKYESYADTNTLKPLRFIRNVLEGGNYTVDDYIFYQNKNKVYTSSKRNNKHPKLDSIKITQCTNDVLTAVFQARCLNFSNYKPNDTIPITFVLDGEIFPSYIRYIGIETINDDILGKIRCIKFRPKLVAGTIFKGGEGMTVWVTDDKNKLPVYVETPIVVGTIKAYLLKYEGLRNKMECSVK